MHSLHRVVLYPGRCLGVLCSLFGLGQLIFPDVLEGATVVWDGGGGNNSWHTPANWSGDTVPGTGDDVVIDVPGDITVILSSGSIQVRSLQSEEGFQITGGSLTLTAGSSFVHGPLRLGAGTLTVRGAGTMFQATGTVTNETANLAAQQGAVLSLPTLQRLLRTASGNYNFLASDPSSIIDLPNLSQATTAPFYRLELEARSGGHIHVPSLAQISALSAYSDGAGSVVDMSGLPGFLQNTSPGTSSMEVRNGGSILAPGLAALDRISLLIRSGGQFPTAQLEAITGAELLLDAATNHFPLLTNVTGNHLTVLKAAHLTLPGVGRLARTNSGALILSATDAGSLLEMPNATNAAVEPFYKLQVEARLGARVDLPQLATLEGAIGALADGTGSVVDMPGLQGHVTNPKAGSAYLEARNGGSVLVPNITELDRIDVTLRGNGTVTLNQVTSFTGAELSLYNTTNSYPGLMNAEASHFTVDSGARLTLPGVTSLNRFVIGDIFLTALNGGVLDFPSVTASHALDFYQLEILASAGGKVLLPKLSTVEGALNALAQNGGALVDLSGLTGRLANTSLGGSYLEARGGGTIHIPYVTRLDRVDLTLRGTGQIDTEQLFAMTQGVLTLDGAAGSFALLADFRASSIALYNGAQLTLPQVTELVRTIAGDIYLTVSGTGSFLSLPNVMSASVQPFYQLELTATGGGVIELPQLASVTGALNVTVNQDGSLIDLSGLQGSLGIVQPGPHQFYAADGGVLLIPNLTGLDQVDLTIKGDGQISTDQLTSLTHSQVALDGATVAFPGLTDTTGTSFQYLNGGGGVFPPVADLTVTGVFAPATAPAEQPVQVVWEVANIGTAVTNGAWMDALLLSADTLPGNDTLVGLAPASGDFPAGATRRFTNTVIFPALRAGVWHVAIVANQNRSLFEGSNIFNNTNVSAATLQIQAPDLVMDSLVLQSNQIRFGESMNVSWTVRNGGTSPAPGPWSDRILLVTNLNTPALGIPLLTFAGMESLAPGATYSRTQMVTLPLVVNGPASGFVVALADIANAVAESKETNNAASSALTLSLPPLPDLAVESVLPPAAALPGQTLELTWAVTNRGDAAAAGVWAESVSIAKADPGAPRLPLGTFLISNQLAAASWASRTQELTLPANLAAGLSRFFVEVDSESTLVESGEANNLATNAPLTTIAAALKLQLSVTRLAENTMPPAVPALVSRNGETNLPLTVTLLSGNPDKLAAPPSVTILAGQSSAAFSLAVQADGIPDADQTVSLVASAPDYASDAASITVLNTDRPQLALQVETPDLEEGGRTEATISRNGPTLAPAEITLAALGTGQLLVPGTVVIPTGSTSAVIEILALEDTLVEPPQSAGLQASAPGYGSAMATLAITDNDLPLFTLTVSSDSISEGAGPEAAVATVSRGAASPRSLTIELESSDPAAARVPGRAVIPSGQVSVSVPIASVNDDLVDGLQTTELRAFALATISEQRVAMSPPVLLFVQDDDGPGLACAVARPLVGEGLATATTMTITRNSGTNQPLALSLTSSDPGEATVPASVNMMPGQSSATVPVTTINDLVRDGNQSVTLTAAAPGFAGGSVTLVVSDLELPDLVVTDLTGPASGPTEGFVNVSYRVLNQGFAPAGTNWITRLSLSADPLVGDDITLADYEFAGTLPVAQFFGQARQIRLPQAPGDYWVVATTDLAGRIDEALENNNTTISALPIHVNAAYQATVQASIESAPAGTPVPLTGAAVLTETGGPAPFVLVNIHLSVRGTQRLFSAVTDADGLFTVVFTPLPGEAGFYEIGAAHPGRADAPIQDFFTLYGLKAESVPAIQMTEQSSAGGRIDLRNLGDLPLTGLTASVLSQPPNVEITLSAPSGGTLPGLAVGFLGFSVTAGAASETRSNAVLRVTSAEGAVLEVSLPIRVDVLRPRLTANPVELIAGMKVGDQAFVQFDVINSGGAASAPVQVALPDLPWLHLASPNPMPALPPGASNRVTLHLTPAADMTLGAYEGWLGVNAGETGTRVPFSFRALSEAKGNLRITAVDEFTYYAQGSPNVAGAAVTIRDAVTEEVVVEGVTGPDGLFTANQLQEGYYDIELTADKHTRYRDLSLLTAGKDNDVLAFLRRETVRYIWTVVPTEIEDRTRVVIETIFEAFVPMPVVTVDPPLIDLADFTADLTQIDLRISNHGLIAAKEARLNFGSHPDWSFEPLIFELGDLPARSTLTVPLLIRRTVAGGEGAGGKFAGVLNAASGSGGGACSVAGNCQFVIECGGSKLPGSADIPMINARAVGDCGGGGGGGTRGAGGGGSGGSGGGGGGPVSSSATIPTCDKCLLSLFKCALDLALPDIGSCLNDLNGCFKAISGGDPNQASYNCLKAYINCAATAGKETMGKVGKVISITECLVDINNACDPLGGGGSQSALAGPTDPYDAALAAKLAGPTVHSAALTTVSRVERAEVTLLRQRAEWLLDEVGPLRYLMGDDIWFRAGQPEVAATWLREFSARIELSSAAGDHISPGELGELLALPLPQAVLPAHAQAFIERWNRSLDYWMAGITQQSQVPAGQNPDFIALDTMNALAEATEEAFAKSAAQGYASPEEAYRHLREDLLHYLGEGDSGGVCAHVRLRLDQEAIVTRDAFAASLEIENASGGPLQNIAIEVAVRRRSGEDATELFGIRAPVLDGITGVDGEGALGMNMTGRATWTLIPTTEAVGAEPEEFLVGGLLKYQQDDLFLTVPLAPASITVHPSPQLKVKYFHQRDVFADDPFTTEIEPAEPFSLAVMVENHGFGAARNVRIQSAQPRIVDNEKGLFADFKIIATEVAGQNLTPSLTVNFGQIDPGANAIGRWLLTSTILGGFIDYSATIEHLDGLGAKKLALIDGVEIHELIHIVRAPGSAEDGRPDFLVNDVPDLYDLADTLHLSDGSIAPVSLVEQASFDQAPTSGNLVVQMTAAAPSGWSYLRLPDPGSGRYRLARVLRSDGVEVRLGDNAWTTDRTFLGNARRPLRENLLHLFDRDSTGVYFLYYANLPPGDTNAPSSSVTPLPADSTARIPVAWSGQDNPGGSGISFFDVYVSTDGGPFLRWQYETFDRGGIFQGGLGRFYAFYSVATDAAGNREAPPLVPDAWTTVTRTNHAPLLAPLANAVVKEGDTMIRQVVAEDPDGDTLIFSLGPNTPPGITIQPYTGLISWITGEGSGPAEYEITVQVLDNGEPRLGSVGTFTVTVTDENSPPMLGPIAGRAIYEGQLLLITNQVTDLDLPPQTLTFSLAPGAPAGASIDPVSGIFQWRPTGFQGGVTLDITIQVQDDGVPPLTDAKTFAVTVRNTQSDLVLALETTNVLAGQSVLVPMRLTSPAGIEAVTFDLLTGDPHWEALGLAPAGGDVVSVALEPEGDGAYRVRMDFDANLAQEGTRTVAHLDVATALAGHSSVAMLRAEGLEGVRSGNVIVNRRPAVGRIFVIENEPLLDIALWTPGHLRLVLYGLPGTVCQLQSAPVLGDESMWEEALTIELSGAREEIDWPVPGDEVRFVRVLVLPR